MHLTIQLKNESGEALAPTTYARSLMDMDAPTYIYFIQCIQFLRAITNHGSSKVVGDSVHFIFHQIHRLMETEKYWEPLADLDWREYTRIKVDTEAYGGLEFIYMDIRWVEVIQVEDN